MSEPKPPIIGKYLNLPKDVRIELAPHDAIDTFGDFADEFMERIFGVECALITDQSSLWDFPYETKAEIMEHIRQVYNVDVSDVADGNLIAVLTRIRGN